MRHFLNLRLHAASVIQVLRWTFLVAPIGVLAGSASALFLWALNGVTDLRFRYEWLLYLLPLSGLAVGLLYHWIGKAAEGGNNLLVDEIHEPGGGVPARMAPLVLIGTLMTHLFGGSAGREGTALQMGGSLASAWGRLFRIAPENRRVLLLAGIAAGFGSVFGTPLAGAIFAMEVLVIGRVQYDALIPVLAAGVIGDMTCSAWGIKHTIYHIHLERPHGLLHLEGALLMKAAAAGILFGLASTLFAELTHSLQKGFKRWMRISYLRPVVGGILVIGLTWMVGNRDYLGLGVDSPLPHAVTILSAFTEGGAHPLSWWWKILFTAVTISSGFKGGEVTPLFFIGATLGSVVGGLLGAPIDLFAGLGFIAVFAAAANTPLACTVMGVELFGGEHAIYFGVACFVAYHCSGHSGIYLSQRLGVPKRHSPAFVPDTSLREVHDADSATSLSPWEWFSPERTKSNFGAPFDGAVRPEQDSIMKHEISSREMGKIRIYLTPRERTEAVGFWGTLNAKPLYRAIINAAKKDGLRNAAAFMSHYGFSDHGEVHAHDVETTNPNLTLCVEIIDHKDKLEEFCRNHGDLLKDKTVVYKHVEHWEIGPKALVEQDASPSTVVDGASDQRLEPKPHHDPKSKA